MSDQKEAAKQLLNKINSEAEQINTVIEDKNKIESTVIGLPFGTMILKTKDNIIHTEVELEQEYIKERMLVKGILIGLPFGAMILFIIEHLFHMQF